MNTQFGKPTGMLRWLNRRRTYSLFEIAQVGYYGIDVAALYGVGAAPTGRCVPSSFDRYEALIPGEVRDWSQFATNPKYTPVHFRDWVLIFGLLAPSEYFPFVRATPGKLTAWLRKELDAIGLGQSEPDRLFSEPSLLIKVGYQVLRRVVAQGVLDSPEGFVGLVLVGLGVEIYALPRRRCEICFRLRVPGLSRCGLHSQSKLNLGTDSFAAGQRAQSSRIARKAVAAHKDLSEILRCSESSADIEHAIASILWPSMVAESTYSLERVKSALESAPRVSRLLPVDFFSLSALEQMTALREKIDPEEWVAPQWPDKILHAEQWYAAEAVVAPGRKRGLSALNVSRVLEIQRLLELGLSKTEVASRLNIGKSHLSHLLYRAQVGGKY